MTSHLASRRGWAFALLVFVSALTAPAWAASNCNPSARIDPNNGQTVPERTTGGALSVVTLDGSNSTPKNGSLTYAWSYRGSTPAGLPVTLNNPGAAIATFTVPDVTPPGAALTFRLTVTCEGNTSLIDTVVNVTDVFVNAPPTASFFISPLNATEGQTVTLDGTASSDPDGQPLTYIWTQIGGSPTVTLVDGNGSGSIKTFVAPNLGATTTLTFRLGVSDGTLSNSTDKGVNILFANDPPVAALTCPAGGVLERNEGQSATFDAGGSTDPEGGPLTYAWSQNVGLPNLGIGGFTTSSITFTTPQLGYNQLGGMTVTVTVTDNQGASASKSCGLFIKDVTAPVILVPDDITAEATSAAGAYVPYTVTSQDAVEDLLPNPLACVPASNSLFALDVSTPVACTDQDIAGNVANAGFNIFVEDTTPPVLTVPGDIATEADGPGGSIVTFSATTSDLVDGDGVATCVPPSGSTFPLGDTTVTCSAEDAHHNAAGDRSFVVSVMDTVPPVIDSHEDIQGVEATGPLGAVVAYDAPATSDAVDGPGSATCAPASGATFALGTTTVTCDAQDAAGNHATPTTFTVEVIDSTPPAIDPVGNIPGVEATGPTGAAVTYASPATHDLVDGAGIASCAPASGATFALGTTTVTCSATDNAGNGASRTFWVQVVDTTAPVIAAQGDLTVEATSALGAIVAYASPSTSDAVDGNGAATCAQAPGTQFALGETTVTCNASDNAGNAATPTTFKVFVVDTTAPALQPHADVNVIAPGNSSAVVTYTSPTATDAVDATPTVACTLPSGSTFPMGSTTVTCTATDDAGNASTSTFHVNVTYAFGGFLRPIDNVPVVNVVKAGQAIPVKFSLGGNQGLSIFWAGYPKAVAMSCTGSLQDVIEETVTAGSSTLQYDAGAGQYIYVWKTDKAWAGTCRQLQVKFADGSLQVASFNFTR